MGIWILVMMIKSGYGVGVVPIAMKDLEACQRAAITTSKQDYYAYCVNKDTGQALIFTAGKLESN